MKIKMLLYLILVFGAMACQQNNYVFEEHQDTKNAWALEDSIRFTFSPKDTLQQYNVYISLRNSLAYEFQNIFLISSITFPNGKVVVDTLEYPMAYNDGRFMGNGTSIIENKLWLKENVRFSEQGEYIFHIRHAMRKANEVKPLDKLEGIVDVGLQIENSKK